MSDRLKGAYKRYNYKFFGNLLPNPPDVKISWADLGNQLMGYQLEDEIVLSKKYHRHDSLWRATLLHEMCHISTITEKTEHGPRFRKELRRIIVAGAFDDLL
jgi:hypothetical protein